MRALVAIAAVSLCAGCVTTETVEFQAKAQQRSVVRDGQPALVSEKKNSLVIVRPASRQFQNGARPVYVVGIYNRTTSPQDFRVASIDVTQVVNGEATPLKVITYDQLVSEEKTRQTIAAIGVGLAAAGNSYNASRAGYYNSTSTVSGPRGTYNVTTSGYSPAAASIAQSTANAQNTEMIAATIERGQSNLAALEQGVIKDNTLFPGEWYGGQLHLQPPLAENSASKKYSIAILVGLEKHEIDVAHVQSR